MLLLWLYRFSLKSQSMSHLRIGHLFRLRVSILVHSDFTELLGHQFTPSTEIIDSHQPDVLQCAKGNFSD